MLGTSVAHEHNTLADLMAALSVGGALINRMDEIDAVADSVALNNSVTHGDGRSCKV